VNKGHLQHAGVVLGGLLEAREDATAFFEPADESFDDVALSVDLLVNGMLSVSHTFLRPCHSRINSVRRNK
jgi:hypothetical protein